MDVLGDSIAESRKKCNLPAAAAWLPPSGGAGAQRLRGACRGRCPHRPTFLKPFFSFSAEKEKNGFNLPRKERGQGAYRCPEFDSKNLSHQLSVTPDPTSRKVSALCASPFGRAAQQNRRLRADRVVRPYRMLRIRKKPLARHHQDSVRRVVGPREVTWGGQMRPGE